MCSRNLTSAIKDFFHAFGRYRGWMPLVSARKTVLSPAPSPENIIFNQARCLSDKAFKLSDIVKANAKHNPGKVVGTVTQKQLKKTATTKAKKTDSLEETNDTETSDKTSNTKTRKKKSVEETNGTATTDKASSGIIRKEKTDTVENIDKDTEVTEDDIIINPVPTYLKSILEIPMVLDKEVDTADLKEFLEDLELKYLPSVSTIISATQSPDQVKVLERWKTNMTKELGGPEQFNQYRKGLLNNGVNLHACIQNLLLGTPDATPLSEGNQGHWESIAKVLPDVNDVVFMEKECAHPELFYRGKFDCIARYRGTLCLIEWKTSAKPKPLLSNTYDNPLQLAAYLGAINRSQMLKKQGLDELTNGAIVIAYTDGEPATVHAMNKKQCERYWKLWVKRVYSYWVMKYDEKILSVDSPS